MIVAAAMTMLVCSTPAFAAQQQGAKKLRVSASVISIGKEVRVNGSIAAGTVDGAGPRSRWRVLLQQRVATRGQTSWRTRTRGQLAKNTKSGRFLLRWRDTPTGRSAQRRAGAEPLGAQSAVIAGLIVRVVVTAGAQIIGQSIRRQVPAAPVVAAPKSCASAHVIGVRGSGERETDGAGYGRTVKAVVDEVRDLDTSASTEYVNYPAIAVQPWDASYFAFRYNDSVGVGISSLLSHISAFLQKCHKSRLYLAGFSQGAHVVADTYLGWLSNPERARVAKIAILGEPKFKGDQTPAETESKSVNQGSYSHHLHGVVARTAANRHNWPRADWPKVRSYCAQGDPVCNFSSPGQALGCKVAGDSCAHLVYPNTLLKDGRTYTRAAAEFLVGRSSPPPSGGSEGSIPIAPTPSPSPSPSPSPLGGSANALAAGTYHSCAVRAGGTISCWGSRPALGDGTDTDSLTPVAVTGISDATQIAAGTYHSCAVRADGTISCWGGNDNGQLGNGTRMHSLTPVAVTGISDATQIAAAQTVRNDHSCALHASGRISCWGSLYTGSVAAHTTHTDSLTPVTVAGISDATQITTGLAHSCALRAGGTIVCWGNNGLGQLGDGTSTDSLTPVAVTGISDATQIAAGIYHSCAVRAGGTISCWGGNDNGQLGNGTRMHSLTPVAVTGISDATHIAAGSYHSCALRAGGTISCWGIGQLGDGTTNALSPVAVTGVSDATQIAAGHGHSCAVRAGGTISCWGNNAQGQLGDGTRTTSFTPVAVTGFP